MRFKLYYILRPIIPRWLQLKLRRRYVRKLRKKFTHIWPINEASSTPPENWLGWPEKRKFALVLTHDVETSSGVKKCWPLIEIEKNLGFRSSYNFVPERYTVDPKLREYLNKINFEVGVHGLNHDGKLFKSKKIFLERLPKINHYLKEWNSVGFRAPAMHHNLEWIHKLNIEYDASTFDIDPFEPQPDNMNTIFPFYVENASRSNGYVELPYTLPQDHGLFIILQEKDNTIWKKKLDWIIESGGMVLINTHPDYMNFNNGKLGLDEYPAEFYEDLLRYIKEKYAGMYWHVLPKELSEFWKKFQHK